MRTNVDYLIIGAGMAADAAVRGIRATDTEGSVLVVGAEPDAPVRRPALSKDLWTSDDGPADADLGTAAVGAEVRLDARVSEIDPDQHVARIGDDEIGYGQALLATGALPRELDGVPASDRVLYFRTLADYRRLRRLAQRGSHVVVVGGGYIGSEVAAALKQNDVEVTMVFPEDTPGANRFPEPIASQVRATYADHGVELLAGRTVASATTRDDGVDVLLDDGTSLDAVAVVVGLGVRPASDLAGQAGIELDDDAGVKVDERLRTSAPDVLAAGDVASFVDPRLGRRRVEHEDNATTMGEAAGRLMAGETLTYQHTPFFYSDLFDLGYEAVGRLDASLETVVDEVGDGSVVYYADGDRVVGVLLWNVWDAVDAARDVLAAGITATEASGRIPAA